MPKKRLDILMVERGLAESREKAQAVIGAGQVLVAGQLVAKPSHTVDDAVPLEIKASPRFVSRGGDKLEGAFQAFGLKVAGLVCLDVGASTGGFTDCLLQYGAAKVYCVDVGKGQLHWKLRNDSRVVAMEQVNARYLKAADLPEKARFATVDVSFISLTKVLPAVIQMLEIPAELITLIKPQFEAGRKEVGKGGVVRDPEVRTAVVEKIRAWGMAELGLEWIGVCESPIKGPAGNVEFLARWRLSGGKKTQEL